MKNEKQFKKTTLQLSEIENNHIDYEHKRSPRSRRTLTRAADSSAGSYKYLAYPSVVSIPYKQTQQC